MLFRSIKSRIETGKYPSLDAVRQDLELCFKNAKKYNMKDSPIRKDAKHFTYVGDADPPFT